MYRQKIKIDIKEILIIEKDNYLRDRYIYTIN